MGEIDWGELEAAGRKKESAGRSMMGLWVTLLTGHPTGLIVAISFPYQPEKPSQESSWSGCYLAERSKASFKQYFAHFCVITPRRQHAETGEGCLYSWVKHWGGQRQMVQLSAHAGSQKPCQHLSHQPAAFETSIRLPIMLIMQEAADLWPHLALAFYSCKHQGQSDGLPEEVRRAASDSASISLVI